VGITFEKKGFIASQLDGTTNLANWTNWYCFAIFV